MILLPRKPVIIAIYPLCNPYDPCCLHFLFHSPYIIPRSMSWDRTPALGALDLVRCHNTLLLHPLQPPNVSRYSQYCILYHNGRVAGGVLILGEGIPPTDAVLVCGKNLQRGSHDFQTCHFDWLAVEEVQLSYYNKETVYLSLAHIMLT